MPPRRSCFGPANSKTSYKHFIVEGDDGSFYHIELSALSAVDRALFSRRLHFIPVGFDRGPTLTATASTNHKPPQEVDLCLGLDPAILTSVPNTIVESLRRFHSHFHIVDKDSVSPTESSRGPPTFHAFTKFGPGKHLISMLNKEIPRECRTCRWFTAWTLCTEARENQLGIFVRIIGPRPAAALPYEVDCLPYPLRNLHDACHVLSLHSTTP